MKDPVAMKESVVVHNQRLSLLINNKPLVLAGPWHFDADEKTSADIQQTLRELPLTFNYLLRIDQENYLIHPDDIHYIDELIRVVEEGKSQDYHVRLIAPSGKISTLHGFARLETSEKTFATDSSHEPESLTLFELLTDSGYWTLNLRTLQLFYSDQLYKIFGVDAQALGSTAEALSRYIHPDDVGKVTENLRERKGSKQLISSVYRIVRPDGEVRVVREKSYPFTDRQGEKFLVGTITDITEEHNHERTAKDQKVEAAGLKDELEKLENSYNEVLYHKNLLQKCLDAIPQMVWLSDAKGHFMLFNDRFHSYTGLTHEGSARYKYVKSGLIHPSQLNEVTTRWLHCLKYGTSYSNETLLKNQQGEYQWFLDQILPIKNDKDEVVMWVGSLTDVNEQFMAEKTVQENNDLLGAIFNSSTNAIQVFDSVRDDNTNKIVDFQWKFYNIIAHELFNSTDLKDHLLSRVYPDAVSSGMIEKFKEVVLKGDPSQFEHVYKSENAQKWFEVSAVKLEDGVVATFHDITLRKQAEVEAEESRHFIQQIANSTPDIIYVIDLIEQRIIYANGKVRDYLGYDAQLLYRLGPSVFEKVMHPDDLERRMEQINSLFTIKDNETREIDVRFKTVNGQWRWFRIRDALFKRSKDGSVWQTIGLAQDIHDLKTTQDKVYLQHQVDRQAEKIAQIGTWQWNLTTDEVVWGENLYYLLELTPGKEPPTFQNFINAVHEEDRDFFYREIKRIRNMEDGPMQLFYYRVPLKNGGMRHLRAASELITSNGERLIIGTVRDVTSEVINERELKERINLIETLVESSANRIAVVDANLTYLVWNRKCEEVYGLKKEQVLGKTIKQLYPNFEKNPVILDRMTRALKGEFLHFPNEKSIRTERYSEVFYIPLKNEHNETYAVLNMLHDITDKVKSQQELERLNQSLKQKNHELKVMNEQLSTFAFIASHDLREPLRKIQVFSNTILAGEANNLTEKGKDYFYKILSSISRMNGLIEDILTFSRVHSNPRSASVYDLNEVVESVKTDLSELIREKGAVIQSEKLPQVRANKSQLLQLVQNLLTNAIKFQMPGNTPVITIRGAIISKDQIKHPGAKAEKYVLLEVADNGIGFEEQYLKKIFQMFQRLHGSSQFTGTGMGLAICKKVMENHDGFIIARSEPGIGSVFSCYFPDQQSTES